jgi:NACHT domain
MMSISRINAITNSESTPQTNVKLQEFQSHHFKSLIESPYTIDQNQVQSIDFWVTNFNQEKSAKNIPLLIIGDTGSGKSSLISKWHEYQNTYHEKAKNLVILDNISLNSTPSYNTTLYNIFNKLREIYSLPDRPSILENNLRMNFLKLLKTVNDIHKSTRKGHVVIIIDGIDLFKEHDGKEESTSWLPFYLPDSIKLICTCTSNSLAGNTLKDKSRVIFIDSLSKKLRKYMLEQYLTKYPYIQSSENLDDIKNFIKEDPCGNPLYLKMIIIWRLSYFPGTPRFIIPDAKEIPDIKSLYLYSIRFYSKSCKNSIKKVLGCLCVCKYNLHIEEIALSSGISIKLTSKILQIFEHILIKNEDFYFFANSIFRDPSILDNHVHISKQIALNLEETNNIERIPELLHALYISNEYKALKNKLRNIQIFGYLYKLDTKLDLCRYWVELEKNGYDPVEEYNKTIEEFVSTNQLITSEEIVTVLLKFFCFFQEYGETENPKMMTFRNYPISCGTVFEDVNLLPELQQHPEVFDSLPKSPIHENEIFLIKETNKNNFREIVLDESKSEKNVKSSYFHYKRWLWIQFPWIILSSSIDASAVLCSFKNSFKGTSKVMSFEQEKKFHEKFVNIINLNKKIKLVPKSRPQISSNGLKRSRSSKIISKNLGLQNSSLIAKETSSIQSNLNKSMSTLLSKKTIEDKPETYFLKFSLRDTEMNTVLLKLDNQLVKFSEVELNKKHKEVIQLTKSYNKLIEIHRNKVKEIEFISTQIDQFETKYKEKEEVLQRINFLQFQTNKNLEKVVIAQSENDYLAKVYNCCLKNPPFAPVWNNDLIAVIDFCKNFISHEKSKIEKYEQAQLEYNHQITSLKPLITTKKSFSTNTLQKLSEKYSLNAYINKYIVKGYNRRKLLLLYPEEKIDSSFMISRLKSRKQMFIKLSVTKLYLKKKLDYFKDIFQKIKKISRDQDYIDIYSIITIFQQRGELLRKKENIEKNLKELKLEKADLEQKLKYLMTFKKPVIEVDEEPKNFHETADKLYWSNNKLIDLENKINQQEFKIIKIKDTVQFFWKKFNISEPCPLNSDNAKMIFQTLGDKILEQSALILSSEDKPKKIPDISFLQKSVIIEERKSNSKRTSGIKRLCTMKLKSLKKSP